MKKQKVINVTYRKDSVTFSDWMKYEITLIDEEGKTQVIPAYGKDLQDALSRVVHDKRVVSVQDKTKKFPWWLWAIAWFIYISGVAISTTLVKAPNNSWLFGLGMIIPIGLITLLNRWSIEQNKDRIGKK